MTSGGVDARRKPFVPVTMLDNQSRPHAIQFILDTGFTGQLLLLNRYLDRLGLSITEWIDARPATGEFVRVPYAEATVVWRGTQRRAEILQLDSEPLLGMEFLWNHRITMDAVTDGAVSITPLGGRI